MRNLANWTDWEQSRALKWKSGPNAFFIGSTEEVKWVQTLYKKISVKFKDSSLYRAKHSLLDKNVNNTLVMKFKLKNSLKRPWHCGHSLEDLKEPYCFNAILITLFLRSRKRKGCSSNNLKVNKISTIQIGTNNLLYISNGLVLYLLFLILSSIKNI